MQDIWHSTSGVALCFLLSAAAAIYFVLFSLKSAKCADPARIVSRFAVALSSYARRTEKELLPYQLMTGVELMTISFALLCHSFVVTFDSLAVSSACFCCCPCIIDMMRCLLLLRLLLFLAGYPLLLLLFLILFLLPVFFFPASSCGLPFCPHAIPCAWFPGSPPCCLHEAPPRRLPWGGARASDGSGTP